MQFVKVNGVVKQAQRAPEPGAARVDATLRLAVCASCPGGFYGGAAGPTSVICKAGTGCVGCGNQHAAIDAESGSCPFHFW